MHQIWHKIICLPVSSCTLNNLKDVRDKLEALAGDKEYDNNDQDGHHTVLLNIKEDDNNDQDGHHTVLLNIKEDYNNDQDGHHMFLLNIQIIEL